MRLAVAAPLLAACPGAPTPTPEGFVRIEAGTFTMGNPPGQPAHAGNDAQHEVTLTRPLFVQIHEVTRREFAALMGAVPRPWSPHGDEVPVTQINWYEAIEYANALSRAQGLEPCYRTSGAHGRPGAGCRAEQFGCGPGSLWPEWEQEGYALASVQLVGLDCPGYRLPTEAEWEHAAAAGHDADAALDLVAWYDANTREGPAPVGQRAANRLGLHDMLGNAWELCWDLDSELTAAAAVDPTGPSSGDQRVARGGSYVDGAPELRPTRRISGSQSGRNANVGFRLVRTASSR